LPEGCFVVSFLLVFLDLSSQDLVVKRRDKLRFSQFFSKLRELKSVVFRVGDGVKFFSSTNIIFRTKNEESWFSSSLVRNRILVDFGNAPKFPQKSTTMA